MRDNHAANGGRWRRGRGRRCGCGPAGGARNLRQCVGGERVVVLRVSAELACATRLRELGILEGETVLVLRQSDPVVILAQDSRIAIDTRTAEGIEVDGAPD